MRVIYVFIIVLLLSNSVNGNMSYDEISVDINNSIVFDYNNATTAISLLQNSVTEYNITFYGNAWSSVQIDNWKNTGTITFMDDSMINFTAIENNGDIYLFGGSIGFINSIIDTITVDSGTILQLENTDVDELIKIENNQVVNVNIVESTIQYLNNPIIVDDGDVSIDRLNIYGNTVSGMNISIDPLSEIIAGNIKISLSYNNLDMKLIINGFYGIEYEFQLNLGLSKSHLEINDVYINKFSNIQNVYNFTMTNTKINGDILYLYNTNGTMNYISDVNGEAVLNIIESSMDFNNTEVFAIKIEIDGMKFNSDYKISFNNTIIHGDLEWNALCIFTYNNLIIGGNLTLKAVVNSKTSYWENTASGINFLNVIKTTILNSELFNIHYNFILLTGSVFTIESSDIYYISSVNSTIIFNNSNIMSGEFGYNSTVIINNSNIHQGFYISENSKFSFINSYFNQGTYDWKDSFTDLYFDNTTVNGNIYLNTQNITSINSHFNLIWRPFSSDASYFFNFTDSEIDKFRVTTTDSLTYITMQNTSIISWGGNNDLHSKLYIKLIDSNIVYSDDINWKWDSILYLEIENTVLNRANTNNPAVFLEQIIYDDYTELNYLFEDYVYGVQNTEDYTIQRSKLINGIWSRWAVLGIVSSTSYTDNTIMDGEIYSYRVLRHYSTGFMIYQTTVNIYDSNAYLIPAGMAYNLTVSGLDDRIDFNVNRDLQVELKVSMNTYDYTPFDTITVQYEYFKTGEVGTITNTSSSVIQIRIDEPGNYTFKVRIIGETVRVWSEWYEIKFEMYTITQPYTNPVTESNSENTPAFQMVFVLSVVLVIFSRKKYDYYSN